jgi:hypothetical protein
MQPVNLVGHAVEARFKVRRFVVGQLAVVGAAQAVLVIADAAQVVADALELMVIDRAVVARFVQLSSQVSRSFSVQFP